MANATSAIAAVCPGSTHTRAVWRLSGAGTMGAFWKNCSANGTIQSVGVQVSGGNLLLDSRARPSAVG